MRIILLFCLVLQSSLSHGQYFDKDKLLDNLQEFSSDQFAGRRPGQDGGRKSREFVRDQFKALNLESFNDSYFQEFTITSKKGKEYTAYNVYAYIIGTESPDTYMVVSSHHDHLGIRDGLIYNGADDNGSGTCALFALAEYFKKSPPKHSIIFVAFDAEEWGLRGAKAFVSNPPVSRNSILINFNMDMIGRNDQNEIYICGTRHYPELKDVCTSVASDLTVLFGHDGGDGKQDWTQSSDHGPFHEEKIPFLYFGEEDHDDYHKPTDTFDGIQPEFYINAVDLVLEVIKAYDRK